MGKHLTKKQFLNEWGHLDTERERRNYLSRSLAGVVVSRVPPHEAVEKCTIDEWIDVVDNFNSMTVRCSRPWRDLVTWEGI